MSPPIALERHGAKPPAVRIATFFGFIFVLLLLLFMKIMRILRRKNP